MALTLVKPQSREQFASGLHISYSQLNTYLICPMKYAHNYVYGTLWERKPAALALGSAVHKSAEHFYLQFKDYNKIISCDEMISVFTDALNQDFEISDVPWTFKADENVDTLREHGIELVRLFHAEASPQKVMAVELPFSVSIPDTANEGEQLPIRLTGFMDLVESDSDGAYCVVELKTSSQRYSKIKLEYDLQASVYSYAMHKMRLSTSNDSTLIRYDVLIKSKKPAFEKYFVTRTHADHQRLIELLNQVLRAIEQRVFYRNTGWQCGDCQFRGACLGS